MPAPIEFKKSPAQDASDTRDRAGAILLFPAPIPSSNSQSVDDIVSAATPAKRKRGKSLSRRTGQDGHTEKSGRWFVVRYWKDIAGQEKREHMRERICPISGPGLLSKSERKRKANSKRDAPSLWKPARPLAHSQTYKDGSGSERNGLARIQTLPQDMVAWSTLFGGHQRLLDGSPAANHVRTLLAPS